MWYPPKTVTPPEAEPVTKEEAKRQCVVLHNDDDMLFEALIASARDHVEKYCNIVLSTQPIEAKCDGFCDMAWLPIGPVQSVSSIAYVATDGTAATVALEDTELRADGLDAAIVPAYGKQWSAIQMGSRITLTVVAGYESAPPAVKHAMLLWIADAYENRENAESAGFSAFDALLSNYRRG